MSNYKKVENSKGEYVFFRHDAGARFVVGAYLLTSWGSGPFAIGTEYGSKTAMEKYFEEIAAGIRSREAA